MITLIGHGYIGQYIAKELSNQKQKFNWIHHADVIPSDTKFIINSAGYTGNPNTDSCERERQETIDGNVLFPLRLEFNNPNIPILHISSACLYTGYDKHHNENSIPNVDFNTGGFYIGSKVLEQNLLEFFMHKSYLFRIHLPFSSDRHPKNLFTKLEKYDKLIDCANSISCATDVAKAVVYFTLNRPAYGIYNVANPGYTSTKEIADILGLEKQWFTEQEFNDTVIAPRNNCILDTAKLQSVFPLMDVTSAIKLAAENYK